MGAATLNLLVLPDPADESAYWAFQMDHEMHHRALLRAGGGNLSLLLDPMQYTGLPGSNWHLDHQQAHNAARGGINSDQILRDSDLFDRDQQLWWTFTNHQEHVLLTAALSENS